MIINGVNFGLSDGDTRNYPLMDTNGSLREQSVYVITQRAYAELNAKLIDHRLDPFKINPSTFGDPDFDKWHPLALTNALDNYIKGLPINDPGGIVDYLGLTHDPCTPAPIPVPSCPGNNITGVVILDNQLGDIDPSYDANFSPGPQSGIMSQMSIYSWVSAPGANRVGTYMQVKEGKLYNPETHQVVRSISSKDHVDLISRSIQLSNNTQRFCRLSGGSFVRVPFLDTASVVPNPVQACTGCFGANITKTCFDPVSRILFIRTIVGDTSVRKWFTDVTRGL